VLSPTGLSGEYEIYYASINHTQDYDTLVLSQTYNDGGSSHGVSDGIIAIADINRVTGEVSGATIVAEDANGYIGYHATFSEDGSKIYYARGPACGAQDTAYQYDVDTGIETLLGGNGLGASKLAPNGKIYWAGFGRTALSIVHSPNEAGADADFELDGLSLEGCESGYGVPNQNAAFLDYLPPIE